MRRTSPARDSAPRYLTWPRVLIVAIGAGAVAGTRPRTFRRSSAASTGALPEAPRPKPALATHLGTQCAKSFLDNWYFMHIPKTGGTSLEMALCGGQFMCHSKLNRTCPHIPPLNVRAESLAARTFVQNHVPKAEMIACGMVPADYFDGKPTICTVREPVARFLSEAAHRRAAVDVDLMESCKMVMHKVQTNDSRLTLGEWNRYTHCRPQVDFTGVDASNCDVIFDTEELGTKAVQFAQQHNLAKAIPTHGHNKHKIANVSAKVRAWMDEIYAQDYELYARLNEIQSAKPLMHQRRKEKAGAAC